MYAFRHRFAWILAGALGVGFGACRKAPTNVDADASREVPGAVKVASAKVVIDASARGGARTTEEWLARVLELGAMADATARKQALATLLAGMDNEARAVVLEALWALSEGAGRAVFAELFTLWCEGDPQAAAKWAATLWDEIPGREGEQLREQAGFAWAKRDFEVAFAWSLGLRDVGSEWGLAAKILKELALRDPRRALELARGVSEAFYATAVNRIFAGWVEHDPAAAFAELGVACKESSMFPHRLGKWADRDPVAAARWALANDSAWLRSLAGFVEDKGAFMAAVYGAKIDWPKTGDGATGVRSWFLHSWAQADGARALAWIDALPAGEDKTALIRGAGGVISHDAQGKLIPVSVPLILRLPAGEERDRLLNWHLAEWSRSDPDAALRWVQEYPEAGDGVYEAALTGAMSGLAKNDPKAAQVWLDAMPAGEVRGRAEREMAAGWASADPVAAAAWLNERQPDWLSASWGGANSIEQKYRVASGWMDADPDALFAWAASQPDQRDAEHTLANAISPLAYRALNEGGDLSRPVALLLRLPADSQASGGHLAALFANLLQRGDKGRARAEAVLDAQPGLTAERRREILAAGERELASWKASGMVR